MLKGPANVAGGFQTMAMTILEVANGFAYGTDSIGRQVQVPLGVLPAKSPSPMPGETWMISKGTNGLWTFLGIVNNPGPPIITGAISGDALQNLLAALEAAGYIIDNTFTAQSPSAKIVLSGAPGITVSV